MSFSVEQKTLECLEWAEVLARLGAFARTPRGRAKLAAASDGAGASLFEASADGVRERLAETGEALAILDAGDLPPLGGVADVAASLRRARKGGLLAAGALLDLLATLSALRDTQHFLAERGEQAPRLAALAESIVDHAALHSKLERSLEASGEVRDDASAALAEARRAVRRSTGEIQDRVARLLKDPDTLARLSDAYYTVRNDRYVLPVRADAQAAVRGIVHDASRSGTTVFIEPEALVEVNNRHKQAEIAVERETLRVLRDLSSAAAAAADSIEAGLEALESVDLAFARAQLAAELGATEPEVGDEGVLRLPQLRHPSLSRDEVVPNDLRLGEDFNVLVLSGPNAGGKTVAMKAVALAVLFVRAGLFVPAAAPSRVDRFDAVLGDIGDEQDIREHLSTFSAHMANLARITDAASRRSLVVLDEVGVGTDPGEGSALAQAVLEKLADAGARVIATTHYNLLKEMAEVDDRFANASVEFDPESLAPTFRLRMDLPGASSATAVAARMGMRADVLERANQLLEREDRRLDRMLSELAASRAALEHEQREARRVRAESETVRADYRARLEKLQQRRDTLYRSMRDDLDRAFRGAHEQVASVIRDLQRGGTAQDAARARESLLAAEEAAQRAEPEAGVDTSEAPDLAAVDWQRAQPGDRVRVQGGGSAVLVALPDHRGRVAVRMGSARVLLPMERVGPAGETPPVQPRSRVAVTRSGPGPSDDEDLAGGDAGRCDLRGLRVDEAIDRLTHALDRAAAAGRERLMVVHGIGTGALRDAVRRHLAQSPYVARFAAAAAAEGGAGATLVELD
jgi:DNA mismatch repair protein MutS2